MIFRLPRCVSGRSLETTLKAISAAGTAEKVYHRTIPDVFETALAAKTTLVPDFAIGFHKSAVALQNKDGFAAGRAIPFGSTIGRETWPTEEPGSRANIFNREAGTNRRGIGVYGGIGRKRS